MAEVLQEKTIPSSTGATRLRLIQTREKYPVVRVEDELDTSGNIVLQTAIAADHVLVKARPGVARGALTQGLKTYGMVIDRQISSSGLYIANVQHISVDGVSDAVQASTNLLSLIEYAEPDYMVFATESLPMPDLDRHVVVDAAGVAWDCERMLPIQNGESIGASFSVLDPSAVLSEAKARLEEWPEGARLITFDKPAFMGGPGEFYPMLEEQGFVFDLPSAYMYVDGVSISGSSLIPDNGTMHARYAMFQNPTHIYHRDNLPFTAHSVDLAEYSTISIDTTIDFTGHKTNGTTVAHTFYLDGVIDGNGPLQDFETFSFPLEFSDLAWLEIPGYGFRIDNLIVSATGQETVPPAPPVLPVYYQVTFDAPIHISGTNPHVGGPFSPTSFFLPGSSPTVVSEFGSMTNALQFDAKDQVRFSIRQNALRYRLEFDICMIASGYHSVLFDGNNLQRLDFKNQTIGLYQDAVSGEPGSIGSLPLNAVEHMTVDIDMIAGVWQVFQSTNLLYTGAFDVSFGDLTDIRFANSTYQTDPVLGIDNIVIYTYGIRGMVGGPKLALLPLSVEFPDTAIGMEVSTPARVQNEGDDVLFVTGAAMTGSAFGADIAPPFSLLPGEYRDFLVTFHPTETSSVTSRLDLASNDAGGGNTNMTLNGFGHGPAVLVLQPTNLWISMLPGKLGSEVFSISNAGVYRLEWQFINAWETQDLAETNPAAVIPDDPLFSSQWALQDPDVRAGGIDLVHASMIQHQTGDVLVAVIDTGVDYTHPELASRMWVNSGEVPGNGIDDDGNGFVDDVHGFNFCTTSGDPMDGNGHGTHIAGIIAAQQWDGMGVAGVSANARIVALKFLSDSGSGFTSDAVMAFDYAVRCGARVLNNSWGGGGSALALIEAIRRAESNDCLIVVAAGNNNQDLDVRGYFPSCYDSENIVSVAATDEEGRLSFFSNYGNRQVDIGAPGSDILSLAPGNGYCIKSGTSMAAPHISGVAAMMLSRHPYLSALHIKRTLMQSADASPYLCGKTVTGGKINAYKAVRNTHPEWVWPIETYGKVDPGTAEEITLTIDTRGLMVGSYTNALRILSDDPSNQEARLPVMLNVLPANELNDWINVEFAESNMLFNSSEESLWSSSADPDGDGLTNQEEFERGTDPLDPNSPPVHYVISNNPGAQTPYTNWSTAAATIQDAVDAAADGDKILVTNGVYNVGGRIVAGCAVSNRVDMTNNVLLVSVNGPDVTHIVGVKPRGPFAVRCLHMTQGTISGFTLRDGGSGSGPTQADYSAGGVWMENGVIRNCVVRDCDAQQAGGIWMESGTVTCTRVEGNAGDYGGGIRGGGVIDRCVIANNTSPSEAGGVLLEVGTIQDCVIVSNVAVAGSGGGIAFCNGEARSCTIVYNSAVYGGGVCYASNHVGGAVQNSIVYYNMSSGDPSYPNYANGSDFLSPSCCEWPLGGGAGCFTNPPLFLGAENHDYRLQPSSPCIDAADDAYAVGNADLDGNPRVIGLHMDVGAYESSTPHVVFTVNTVRGDTTSVEATTSDWNVVVNAAVSSPEGNGTTQYVCTGWSGTGSVTNGSGTNVSFAITNDSSVTWIWSTSYYLTLSTNGHGSLDETNGWNAAGSTNVVTATPSNHWHFTRWSGNTGGCLSVANVMTAVMTQARAIVADFAIDQHTLQIVSQHGTSAPIGGTYTNSFGTVLTNQVSQQQTVGTTQYVSQGWVMTGNEPLAGAATTITMTMTNNSTLTWQWQTQYWVSVTAGVCGRVAPTNGAWVATGSSSPAYTATPSNSWVVAQWLVNGAVVQVGGTNFTVTNVTAPALVSVWFDAPPVLQALTNRSALIGQAVSFGVTATDPDGTTPTLSAPVKPAAAGFVDNGNGTGTFNWTPSTPADIGQTNLQFVASDSQLSITGNMSIAVSSLAVTNPVADALLRKGGPISVGWVGSWALGAANIELWQGTNLVRSLTNGLSAPVSNMVWEGMLTPPLRAGVGYWIRVTDADTPADQAGSGFFLIIDSGLPWLQLLLE